MEPLGKYRIREYHETFQVQELFLVFPKGRSHKSETIEAWHDSTLNGLPWEERIEEFLPPLAEFKTLKEAKDFISMIRKPEKFHYL